METLEIYADILADDETQCAIVILDSVGVMLFSITDSFFDTIDEQQISPPPRFRHGEEIPNE